jgi:hypothetical protein
MDAPNYTIEDHEKAVVLTGDDYLGLIKRAIAENLAARLDHDKRREKANRGKEFKIEMWSAAALVGTPQEQLRLEDIVKDPVRRALRAQLKELGQCLYRHVQSIDRMREVAEEAADLMPKRWGYRINIIDKAWDGVGEGDHRWRA